MKTLEHRLGPLASRSLRYTAAVHAALAEQYAPATANKLLTALRGVLNEPWRLGYLDAEAYHRARDLLAVRSKTLPRGQALPAAEQRAFFGACAAGRKTTSVCDAALLAVLYGAGLRRSAVLALELANYDPEFAWDQCLHVWTTAGRGQSRKS